jgi:aldehyde:ferredoxin oxidoreductase
MTNTTSPQLFADTELLYVNLATRLVEAKPLPPALYRAYLGGRGLGVKLVYDAVTPKIDALSPENLLVFAIGPLTATAAPTSGRFAVITKSPLTGTIFDSNAGGYFGPQLRMAGYAAIIIIGRADSPQYLWIEDGKAELRDAQKIWGLDTAKATDSLLEATDKKAQVACIGPAGENLVKLAAIITDKHRAAGRGGVGAVMGSKNLKAVVARGTGKASVVDSDQLENVVNRTRRLLRKTGVTDKSLPVYGTAVLVNLINEYGLLPTHNFQEGTFNDAEGVSGEKMLERLFVKRYHCYGCPIGCGRITRADGVEGGGPEYETVWAFGPQCGINNLEWIATANNQCNLLGLDTISTGSTIGCAMELKQKGKMKAKMEFSETEGLLELIGDIAFARGIGKKLGEGSRNLANHYGAPELAMHVKGLEIPAYDPRGVQGHALSYATSNRGGCHLRAYLIGPEIIGSPVLVDRDRTNGKAELVILFQDLSAAMDSLVLCRFTSFAWSVADYSDFTSAATGFSIDSRSLLKIGERIWNLERMFNVREGFGAKDDCLPPRFQSPLPEGGSRNRIVRLDVMLPEYYQLRGWQKTGVPTKTKLDELDL